MTNLDSAQTKQFISSRSTDAKEFDSKTEWEKFNGEFIHFLRPENPVGRSLYVSINKGLIQFKLAGSHSSSEILISVYMRAYAYINVEKKRIHNASAWSRATAYNIIREISRSGQKFVPSGDDLLNRLEAPDEDSEALEADVSVVAQALKQLNPFEQRLLTLKLIDCLPWRDIQIILRTEGYECTETALRKQKERALAKLRQLYHALVLESQF